MKTKTTNNSILKGIKGIAIAALLIAGIKTDSLKAQESAFGLTLKSNCSMSGLGTAFVPQLTYSYGRHQVLLGVNVQKRNLNISGVRLGYTYVVNPEDDAQVFLLADAAYYDKAYLGKRMLSIESRVNSESTDFFSKTRINVFEQHIGFGVRLFSNSPVSLFGSVAGGVYHTLGCSKDLAFGYRDMTDASVMINIGVNVRIYSIK